MTAVLIILIVCHLINLVCNTLRVSSVSEIIVPIVGAILAGLAFIPAVFAFSGGDESALSTGPSLMFVTLPKVFATMPGGSVIGAIFFLMVLFAALTSSISLMETIVSIVMDKFGLGRKKACLTVILLSIILGLLSTLGYSIWSEVKIIGFQFLDSRLGQVPLHFVLAELVEFGHDGVVGLAR